MSAIVSTNSSARMPRLERIESGRDALTMSMRTQSQSDEDAESIEGRFEHSLYPHCTQFVQICQYFV